MSSSNERISIEGKGIILSHYQIPGIIVSNFKIDDVLHLPKLSLPLTIWKEARSKGFCEGTDHIGYSHKCVVTRITF